MFLMVPYFSWLLQSGKFGKLNKEIKFPEILNLAPCVSGTSDKSPIYRLYGVVVHLDVMNSAFSGHYVCYVKTIQNKWFKIDDSTVCSFACWLVHLAFFVGVISSVSEIYIGTFSIWWFEFLASGHFSAFQFFFFETATGSLRNLILGTSSRGRREGNAKPFLHFSSGSSGSIKRTPFV